MVKIICTLAMLALVSGPGIAAETLPSSVFGIKIGANFDVPQCTTFNLNADLGFKTDPRMTYDASQQQTCWKTWPIGAPPTDGAPEERVLLDVHGDTPVWLNSIVLYVIQGKVAGAEVRTTGLRTQALVLRDLITKYGKPDKLTHDDMQTGGGASVQSISAFWNDGALAVSFDGVDDYITSGVVYVVTPQWLAHVREQNAQHASM